MRYILSALLVVLLSLSAAAQKNARIISGRVLDAASGNPLELATVRAMGQNDKQASSAISRSDGTFRLSVPHAGRYEVTVSFVGYGTESVKVDVAERSSDIGTVRLRAGVAVEEVSFSAKPLIRRESDRIVYDVRSDPDASRMKMMKFMEKIPELKMSVSDGRLVYEDMGIGCIYIDGRVSDLINANRQYPMEFIIADYMSQIEVIMPGSPEYDNLQPILSIKLDRALPLGIAGELRPSASSRGAYGIGVDAVTNLPWFVVGLGYKFGYADSPRLHNDTRRENLSEESAVKTSESAATSWSRSRSHDVKVEVGKEILNRRLILNVSLDGSQRVGNSFVESLAKSMDMQGGVVREEPTLSHARDEAPFRLSGSVGFYYSFGDKGEYLRGQYSFADTRNRTVQTLSMPGGNANASRASTGSFTHTLSVGTSVADPGAFSLATVRWMLRFKVGYMDRKYDNASEYMLYDEEAGDFVAVEGRSNGLNYRQRIVNADASFYGKPSKKLNYTVGVTGEYVRNRGTYLSTDDTPLDYREANALPYARMALKVSRSVSMNAGYRMRVMRPNVTMLNPYVDDSDPQNLRMGNPNLRGERAHVFSYSAGYTKFRAWLNSVKLSYKVELSDRLIERVVYLRDDDVAVSTYANMGRSSSQRVSLSLGMGLISGWANLSLAGDYTHDRYRLSSGYTNIQNRVSGRAGISSSMKGLFDLNITYGMSPSFSSVQGRNSSMYSSLDISASRYFKKLRLGGSIECANVLHGRKVLREEISSPQFRQVSMRERLGRVFSMSLYWRLGKFRNVPLRMDNDAYDTSRETGE